MNMQVQSKMASESPPLLPYVWIEVAILSIMLQKTTKVVFKGEFWD